MFNAATFDPMENAKINNDRPTLLLGTAMWGWTTPPETAYAMLDLWYEKGFRQVDGATNYPINKRPEDFRKAEKILLDWIRTHGITDLEVMMKIGSVNNLRTPEHVLTKSFILMMLDEYGWLFGKNLHTLMVHWDNREEEKAIRKTMEALDEAKKRGFRTGLSGIQRPDIYFGLNKEFEHDFLIQMKHNLLHSDYQKYSVFHGARRFIAYGINAGGLKLDTSYNYKEENSLRARNGENLNIPPLLIDIQDIVKSANETNNRPILDSFHQIGMIYAFYQPDMAGILLGTSSAAQLGASIDFYEIMREENYEDVYERLADKISHK